MEFYGCNYLFECFESEMRGSVGVAQPVDAENSVIREVPEVAAVEPALFALYGVICPFPDATSAKARIFIYKVPVIGRSVLSFVITWLVVIFSTSS